jgi:hypothetical protein
LAILDQSLSHFGSGYYFGQGLPQIAIDWEYSSAVRAFSKLRRFTKVTQNNRPKKIDGASFD